MSKRGLAMIGVAGLAIAWPAAAQDRSDRPPVDPDTATSAMRYALPHMFGEVRQACADHLASDGFLALNGDRLAAKFADGADAHWPSARDFLIAMSQEETGADEGTDLLADLPDEALKPFVDGIVATMLSSEIKSADCATVEHFLELLDPLPADNLAATVGAIIAMVEEDEAKEEAERNAAE